MPFQKTLAWVGQNHHGKEKKCQAPNQNDELIRGKLVCLPQFLQEKWFVYFCTSFFFLMFGGVRFPHQSDLSLRQLTHECCGSHLHTFWWWGEKSPNGLGKCSHACRRTLWIVHCYVGLLGADIFLPVSWTHIEVQEFLVLPWSNKFTSPSITLFQPIPTSQRQRLPVGFQYIQNIDGTAHLWSIFCN